MAFCSHLMPSSSVHPAISKSNCLLVLAALEASGIQKWKGQALGLLHSLHRSLDMPHVRYQNCLCTFHTCTSV